MNAIDVLTNCWTCVQKNPSVVIAFCALAVSVYSARLSSQAFIATHRPYVSAVSRQTKKNGTTVMDANSVLISCLNAPARIITIEFYYLVVETNRNGKEIVHEIEYHKKFPGEDIVYPSEEPREQLAILHDFKKRASELDPKMKLRRKVRIDYGVVKR